MKKQIYIAFVTFVFCLGCNKPLRVFLLKPAVKTIELPVTPMAFAPFDMHIGTYAGNDGSFLYFLSTSDSSVHIVSPDTAFSPKNIRIATWIKTKKHFQSLISTGIWMESANAIWIDFPDQDTVYKLNVSTGEIDDYRVIVMPDNYNGHPLERMRLLPVHPISRSAQTVYFSVNCYYEDVARSDKTPDRAPFFAVFKETGKTLQFTSFAGTLPASYYQKNMYLNESYGITIGSDSTLVNHFYSDSATLVTDHGKTCKSFILKSKKSNVFKGLSGDPNDQNAIMKLFISDQRYIRLLYDPYRNLIYRIYIHQAKETNDGKINIPEKWSFLIFDKSLTPCGEIEMDAENYNPGAVFITQEGIFIRNNKPDPQRSDTTISLQLFKLITETE